MKDRHAFPLLVLLLIPALFPILSNLDSAVPAYGDPFYTTAWRGWWAREQFKDWFLATNVPLATKLQNGLFNLEQIPTMGNVADHLIFGLPLSSLLGFPLSYNVEVVLFFLLNALGGYLLTRRLTGLPAAAILGGFLTAVNPYTLTLLRTGRLRDILLLPLCLSFYFLWGLRGNGPKKHKNLACAVEIPRRPGEAASRLSPLFACVKNGLLAGFFLGLTSILYWPFGMAAAYFCVIFLFFALIDTRGRRSGLLLGMGLAFVVMATIAYPFASPYHQKVTSGEYNGSELVFRQAFPPLQEALGQSPTSLSPLLLDGVQTIVRESLRLSYPFVLSALPLMGLAFLSRRRGNAIFLLVATIFFVSLGFGPYLQIDPERLLIYGNIDIPLLTRQASHAPPNPIYQVFYAFAPVFSRLTRPDRFIAPALLSMAGLSALGSAAILRCIPHRRLILAEAILVLVPGLFYLELFKNRYLPLDLFPAQLPQFYTGLRNMPPCGVIEVPLGRTDLYDYYQSYHGQRIYPSTLENLASASTIPHRISWLSEPLSTRYTSNAFLSALQSPGEPVPSETDIEQGLLELREDGFCYVAVHDYVFDNRFPPSQATSQDTCEFIEKILGKPISVEQEQPVDRKVPAQLQVYGLQVQ